MGSFSGEGLLIFRKRRSLSVGRGFRLFIWLAAFLVLVAWLLIVLERAVIPTLVAISETEVTRVANQAMIDTVNKHVSDLLEGKNLLEFRTGSNGELLYVQVNTVDLNKIQSEALAVLQETFRNLAGFKVYVPLGQTIGSRIFAPSGPRIPVTLYPYGTVRAEIHDSYEVTGINQTKFEVSLKVTCMVRVVIPLIQAKTEVSTEIPLTTVLIPGKIPSTYLAIPK